MKYKFIINKFAGGGACAHPSFLERMKVRFVPEIGEFDHILPASAAEAESAARQCLADGVDRVVSVGGDGAMNCVVNGFFTAGLPAHNGSAILLSNSGAGSDYYSSITQNHRPPTWMDMVARHETRKVDAGRITFHTPDGPSHKFFLNMASVGMIADIVMKKESAGAWVPVALKYFAPTIRSLFTYAPVRLRLTTDTEEIEVEALTVSISKGRFAGKGMRFGLDVELDDGRFEVTIFENSGPARMALKLWRMYSGNYRNVKGIRKLFTRRLAISSGKPIPCEFDGELCGTTDLTIDLLPREVYVCFPKGRGEGEGG
jgi:diacylglycerol kinase family enzyme